MTQEPQLRHILKAQQFDKKRVAAVFELADLMEGVVRHGGSDELKGRIMGTLFYSISTRTRMSFEAAMLRLGGGVVSTEHPEAFSANARGGNLEDTIHMANSYVDVIVLRHPDEGSAERAAAISRVPIINAGDGVGQHPTQALLDLYTIYRILGGIDGVSVALMGDLANSRTARSLCYFLAKYAGVKLWLISPPDFKMRDDIIDYLRRHEVAFTELHEGGDSLNGVLRKVDAVYQTDLPRPAEVATVVATHSGYRIVGPLLDAIPRRAIIMHPFPRIDGISPEVDQDRRAFYFQQMTNGLYVRMALLKMILG